jgi:predicted house-cleaning noncanonical NTP pyrophosphatase (MazG superfamily)
MNGKLVRDKIPHIIQEKGQEAESIILDESTYRDALRRKLEEEVTEYLRDEVPNPDELADILEVVYCLGELDQHTQSDLETRRLKKAEERGSFKERIFLFQES